MQSKGFAASVEGEVSSLKCFAPLARQNASPPGRLKRERMTESQDEGTQAVQAGEPWMPQANGRVRNAISAKADREFVAGTMSTAHGLRCNAPASQASGRFTGMFTPRGIFFPK
ncbi:MAG: hypothetical protein IOC52_01915 [Methylobacterium sp.]|nr:hypothetical protein [Methylobacterium sp.]